MLDGTALESWLYQMNLYFSIETSLPENLRVARAALLLTGNAATWFRASRLGPYYTDMASALVSDEVNFQTCQQRVPSFMIGYVSASNRGSVVDYTVAFRARLLEVQ